MEAKKRRNKYRQRADNGILRPFWALEWKNARKIMGEARGLQKADGNHADGLQGTLLQMEKEWKNIGTNSSLVSLYRRNFLNDIGTDSSLRKSLNPRQQKVMGIRPRKGGGKEDK